MFTNVWSKFPPTLTSHYGSAACCMDKKIFVIGGFDGKNDSAVCEYIDLAISYVAQSVAPYSLMASKWRQFASLNAKRAFPALTTYDNKLYVFGGRSGSQVANTAETFNIKKNEWTYIAKMLTPRFCAAACTIKNRIYIIGGTTTFLSSDALATCEVYDPEKDTFTYTAPMNEPRMQLAACASHDMIYVFGGQNEHARLATCELYNPLTNTWSYVNSMPSPLNEAIACPLDEWIYICGGFDGAQDSINVTRFNIYRQVWINSGPVIRDPMRRQSSDEYDYIPQMSVARSSLCGCGIEFEKL